MGQRPSKKEITELRWAYLQQSARYEKFCTIMQKIAPTATGLTEDQADAISHEYSKWILSKGIHREEEDYDWNSMSVHREEEAYDWHSLYKNWEIYGDVFSEVFKFDDWWDKKGKKILNASIIDLRSMNLGKKLPLLDWPIRKTRLGKMVNEKEKGKLSAQLHTALQRYPEYLFVAVPISELGEDDTLSVQLNKIHQSWIATSEIYDANLVSKRYTGVIANRMRFNEIRFYLEIYKELNDGKPLEELIAKYETVSSHTKYKYKRNYKKAEVIIKNVERGIFPGLYEDSKEQSK